MTPLNRRDFLGGALATGTALAASSLPAAEPAAQPPSAPSARSAPSSAIDFRYSPVEYQTAFCFPDDPHKSLVNQAGHLLYGYNSSAGIYYFPLKIGFALNGMMAPKLLGQRLESPSIPIVHTSLAYPGLSVELTAFATNSTAEGRVDNVLFEVTSQSANAPDFEPVIDLDGSDLFDFEEKDGLLSLLYRQSRQLLLVGRVLPNHPPSVIPGNSFNRGTYRGQQLTLHRGQASKTHPYRAFFRLPQAGQPALPLIAALNTPEACLQSCRAFWTAWQPFRSPVSITLPGRQGEFATACARNILQAREIRDGKLTFQVGPTCYRGLWVVDGNFILEAARYMGLDKEAHRGPPHHLGRPAHHRPGPSAGRQRALERYGHRHLHPGPPVRAEPGLVAAARVGARGRACHRSFCARCRP